MFEGKLPEESILSSLVAISKGKRDPVSPISHRGIKLLQHAFESYEKVLDGRLRKLVDIDKMQNGLMPGKGIVDARFILRRVAEKL